MLPVSVHDSNYNGIILHIVALVDARKHMVRVKEKTSWFGLKKQHWTWTPVSCVKVPVCLTRPPAPTNLYMQISTVCYITCSERWIEYRIEYRIFSLLIPHWGKLRCYSSLYERRNKSARCNNRIRLNKIKLERFTNYKFTVHKLEKLKMHIMALFTDLHVKSSYEKHQPVMLLL